MNSLQRIVDWGPGTAASCDGWTIGFKPKHWERDESFESVALGVYPQSSIFSRLASFPFDVPAQKKIFLVLQVEDSLFQSSEGAFRLASPPVLHVLFASAFSHIDVVIEAVCACYPRAGLTAPPESLTDLATRKLQAGNLVEFEASPAPGAELVVRLLDDIEQKIDKGETIDELHEAIELSLDANSETANTIFKWLQARRRQPRTSWYCLDLLKGHIVKGLSDFLIDILRKGSYSEELLGAVIALRETELPGDSKQQTTDRVLEMLAKFKNGGPPPEESIEERLLLELIDTAAFLGGAASIQSIDSFASRKWSFKVRLRAMDALQSLLTAYPTSHQVRTLVDTNWNDLANTIISLKESCNVSHTARALMYKAFDLYFARLGPECEQLIDDVKQEPDLKRRAKLSVSAAEHALADAKNETWLKQSWVDRIKNSLA